MSSRVKPWLDLEAVSTPARIARLPRDPRGYPIPVNVLNSKGVLDFRARACPKEWG